MRIGLVVLALIATSSLVIAQSSALPSLVLAPVLTEAEQLAFRVMELRAENISLRMTLLRTEFATVQAELNTKIQQLAKEGFTLQRTEDGVWVYVAKPKVEESKK